MTTTTADKGELLPCPFCGEQPTQDDVGSYFVQCPECGVEGPYGSPDAEESAAIAAWNRRPTNEGQNVLPLTEKKTQAIIETKLGGMGLILCEMRSTRQ